LPALIVFSHARWNCDHQRPQQLLSRLARHFPVVFIEEPVPNARYDLFECLVPAPHVEVIRPHSTHSAAGFHDDHLPALQTQLAAFLRERGIDDYFVWFSNPMAVPLVHDLLPRAIIYDCMDALSALNAASSQFIQRENALYHMADLVLTDGATLYEEKRQRHINVHCFPSSAEAALPESNQQETAALGTHWDATADTVHALIKALPDYGRDPEKAADPAIPGKLVQQSGVHETQIFGEIDQPVYLRAPLGTPSAGSTASPV